MRLRAISPLGGNSFKLRQFGRIEARRLGLSGAGQRAGKGLTFFGEASVETGPQVGFDLAAQLAGKRGFEREGVVARGAVDGIFQFSCYQRIDLDRFRVF